MARVYIGTYKKYNNGSIAGKWIDLAQFNSYEEFVKECRKIHKDERDPEYMIQDYEDFPDGLAPQEWISEKDFNDVKEALKEESSQQEAKADSKELLEEYLNEWHKVWGDDKRMMDYERKKVSSIHRLSNGGLICFKKPSIETSFCFGYSDSAYDTEEYDHANKMAHHAATSEEYFLEQNLKYSDNKIKQLESNNDDLCYCIHRESYCSQKEPLNLWRFSMLKWWQYRDAIDRNHCTDLQEIGKEDKDIILNALKAERAKFEKRLRAYLKRYGLSKVKSWSYWRDA